MPMWGIRNCNRNIEENLHGGKTMILASQDTNRSSNLQNLLVQKKRRGYN